MLESQVMEQEFSIVHTPGSVLHSMEMCTETQEAALDSGRPACICTLKLYTKDQLSYLHLITCKAYLDQFFEL